MLALIGQGSSYTNPMSTLTLVAGCLNMGKTMLVHYVLSSNHGIHASTLRAACGRILYRIPIFILISSTNNPRNYSYSLQKGIRLSMYAIGIGR